MDRIPVVPVAAPTIRLHSWYRSAASLLRELSRALNQGQTLLRADSGLPVGTHLVLVMSADCLSESLEVQGTVTAWNVRGRRHEMTLRYDFDPGPQRRQLGEAFAELRRQNYRPRVVPRVPLTLATDAAARRKKQERQWRARAASARVTLEAARQEHDAVCKTGGFYVSGG